MDLALNRKGQVSIEFILIVTIALFYVTAVVWPIVESSTQATYDVKGMSDTKISAMKIANALNEAASSSGYMKKTISIALPDKAIISGNAGSDEVAITVYITAEGGNPYEPKCNPIIEGDPPAAVSYKCDSTISLIPGAATEFYFSGPIFKDVVVKKDSDGISVR